jgi:hypothetical protein
MTKRLSLLTALFGLAVIGTSAMANTLSWWRFEDGVANTDIIHNETDGVYSSDVVDVSGNGNDLSIWTTGGGAGYGYRSDVSSELIPGAGKNLLSARNTGGSPAMWCSADALQTLEPAAWTVEVSFKLENGGWKTFFGRDGDDVIGDNAMMFFQVIGDVGTNQLAVKFCDVDGYFHVAQTEEADYPDGVFTGFNWGEDPNGVNAPWYSTVATSDGSTLSLYLMEIGVDADYELIAQTDISASGSLNTALNNGSTGADGGDWDPGDFTVGRGMWNGGHGDRAYGYLDEVRLSDVALTPAEFMYSGGATGVSDEQSSDLTNGNVDVTLSWTAADNASITDEYVFIRDATDPNGPFYYYGSTGSAPAETSSFGPFDLDFDGSYKVCVVEAVAGSEQSFTAGVSLIDEVNEANITSIVYSFDTMPSVPVITENPANQLVDMDALAEFTVAYTSVTTPVVQWFKSTDNVNNTPDDDTFAGTGDTLSIAATTASDEGFYYAVISNESGVEAISTSARLEVKKLVAWYPFDNTAETAFITDMAGDFDGVIANEVDPNNPVALSYEATADGNAVSFAAVNQTHIEVPRMVQNSFSFEIWVKTTATGGTGGWWNGQGLIDGEMPGWVDDFGSSLLGSKFGFGAQGGNTLSSTSDINDGEWHYCVGTRDQATGDLYLYVDGAQEAEMLATSTAVLDDATVLRIGDILTGGAYFDGQIDDIKVYNYQLTELSVAQAYNDATGESVCVLSRRPSANFDFNGDCIVGLADFTVFAGQWLKCGIYPDCQ